MASLEGERRTVSVLMVDVADSTTIGERLGPERSKFLLDEVTRLMAAEVERFGGTVAQLSGDGLYALFGAPVAHDDDAERAVRAGLAIHEALDRYAKEVGEAYGIELAARVGINTGPVVLLPSDAPPEERYNALGDTVNVAARLQAHAGRGGVAVGTETARHVDRAFALGPLGPLELKGRAEAVEAFLVAGEQADVPRAHTRLVGRDEQLAALDGALGELLEGRGAIVAVTGEAGIGKSRLVAEARAQFEDRVRFLEAQAVSYAQEIPYYPFRSLLRGWLGLGLDDLEARQRLELKARLAETLGDRAQRAYPFLAGLLGVTLEDESAERLRSLAPDAAQIETHGAVIALVRALAEEQPVCLVLEDLHFADEPTLELSRELLGLAETEPVAVLLLYRSDPDVRAWELGEHARRHFRHRFAEFALEPLDAEASASLASEAAGAILPDELARLLSERTGGNPFFLEEALQDLFEQGAVRRVNNHVELAVAEGDLRLPAAVQEALQARLDRLPPEAREVAAVASVAGRTFGLPLLERLVPGEHLTHGLSELQRLDLVVEERRRPAREYRFRHGLVQEAAYQGLLEERRRDLHLRVGEALEELADEDTPVADGTLARHFAEADEPERAARYLLAAGDTARAVYAEDEAIASYRGALAFLDRIGDARRARRTLYKIALAHHLAFDFEGANTAWAEAAARPTPAPVRLEPTEHIASLGGVEEPGRTLPPGYAYDYFSWYLTSHLFRGLMRLEEGLDVVPDLAADVGVSSDGLEYRFRLREGACWSDGEPVTASDFAFTFAAMKEDAAVETAHLLAAIVSAVALDEHTLELRLDEPLPYLPYILAQPCAFPWPRHLIEAEGERWRRPEHVVGNGPYLLRDIEGTHLRLSYNARWDGDRGNVAEIEFESAPRGVEPAAWRAHVLEQWQLGALDVLASPLIFAAPPAGEAVTGTTEGLTVWYVALFPSLPPLDDVRVRRALAHALDRGRLVPPDMHRYMGGMVPPSMPGHTAELAPATDVHLARTLLAEAGYPDGRGLPELTLRTLPLWPGTEELVAQWTRLGVRLRLERMLPDEMFAPSSTPCTVLMGWTADYPDASGMLGVLYAQLSAAGLQGELDTQGAASARGGGGHDGSRRATPDVPRRRPPPRCRSGGLRPHQPTAVVVRRPPLDRGVLGESIHRGANGRARRPPAGVATRSSRARPRRRRPRRASRRPRWATSRRGLHAAPPSAPPCR